jgi:hypothetical protein
VADERRLSLFARDRYRPRGVETAAAPCAVFSEVTDVSGVPGAPPRRLPRLEHLDPERRSGTAGLTRREAHDFLPARSDSWLKPVVLGPPRENLESTQQERDRTTRWLTAQPADGFDANIIAINRVPLDDEEISFQATLDRSWIKQLEKKKKKR